MRELWFAVLLVLGPPTGADPTLPGCTGGIARNPSIEAGPDGYTGPLHVSELHPFDGEHNAAIAGPGTVHADLPAVPGGVYDLSVWSGSSTPGPTTATGLQFLDRDGMPTGRTYARWPTAEKLKRHNNYGMIAPQNAATARFFATSGTEIHWDCVFLRVSAYDVALEHDGTLFRITVTNTGSEPLTNLTLSLAECTDLDRTPFTLKEAEIRTCAGSAPGTVTVSGALYWNGALPDRSASVELG